MAQAASANHRPGSFAFSPPTEGFPGWLALAFTREELLKHVWHDAVGHERMVDLYVFWLRSKIERDPAGPVHLVTVRGSGYLFDPPRTPTADPAGYDTTPDGWPQRTPNVNEPPTQR